MAVTLGTISNYASNTGYPWNYTSPATVNTSGAIALLLLVINGNGSKPTPTVTYQGAVMTLLGGVTTSNGKGWAYGLLSPTQTATGSFNVSVSANGDPAAYIAIPIMGGAADPFGAIGSGAFAEGGTITDSLVTTGDNSVVIGGIMAVYGPAPGGWTHGGSSPTPTVLTTNSSQSGAQAKIMRQDAGAEGSTVTLVNTIQYNNHGIFMVELLDGGGPAGQGLTVPSITNTSAVGTPLAKDPNVEVLGPASIVNSETALGAPTVSRSQIATYEFNGTGNVASGSPAVTVERTTVAANYRNSRASIPIVSSEKRYWEITVDFIAETSIPAIGVGEATTPLDTQLGGWQSPAISWDASGGARQNNTGLNGKGAYVAGDIMMIAVDMVNGWVFMGKNGQWYNGSTAGNVNFSSGDGKVNNANLTLATPIYPMVQTQNIGDKFTSNFGRSAFAYTPPTGFTALDAGGPVRKTISPAAIVNTSEFGTHEVILALKAIYPPSIVNASEMGGHSVIQLAKTVSIENVSVLGNHYVRPVIKPAGLLNSSFLGSHAVGHILKATGIANVSLLGGHKVNSGVSVPGIENTSLLGLHALKTSYQITAPAIVNDNAFGTHQVNQGIEAGGLVNESSIGDATVLAGEVQVSPAGILNESACGTPAVNLALHFVGINNENGLGDHFVTHIYEDAGVYVPSLINLSVIGEHRLKMSVQMQGIGPTDPVFGSHMVTHVPKLSPAGIVNVSALGTHKLAVNMKPLGIVNNSQVGTHEVKLLPLEVAMISIVNVSETGSHMLAYGIRVSGIANVSECGQHSIRLGALLAPSIINENHFGNHEIRIVVGENDKFIRHDGQWRAVETLLVKYDSQWHELDKILEKKDGVWVQIF